MSVKMFINGNLYPQSGNRWLGVETVDWTSLKPVEKVSARLCRPAVFQPGLRCVSTVTARPHYRGYKISSTKRKLEFLLPSLILKLLSGKIAR